MARVFMKGTEAIAEAAVRAGCRFFAGYPITPQNEIPEYLARRLPEVGGSFVQGESEVASINMVYGAAGTGTRAMTSSMYSGAAPVSAPSSRHSRTTPRPPRPAATAGSECGCSLPLPCRRQWT